MQIRQIDSPWGELWLIADDGRLQGVHFGDSGEVPADIPTLPSGALPANPADQWVLDTAETQLSEYAAGMRRRFDLPLMERGTIFQQRIWRALARVPFGQTVSYGSLAALAGRPSAARAVGNAVGANPWVIVVPCHRVLAGGGLLGGFSSGLERKRSLLRLEGIAWRE